MATDRPSYPSDAAEKFIARLPPGMRDRIAEAAKANNRSMNAEVALRLQESFNDRLGFLPADVLRVLARTAEREGRTMEGEVIDRLLLTMRPQLPRSEQEQMLEGEIARAEVRERFLEAEKRSARMQLVVYANDMLRLFDFLRDGLSASEQEEVAELRARTASYIAWADTEMWDMEKMKAKMSAAIAELEEHYRKIEAIDTLLADRPTNP